MVPVSAHKRPVLVREFLIIGIAFRTVAVEAAVVYVAVNDRARSCDGVSIRCCGERDHLLPVSMVRVSAVMAEFEVVVCANVH